MFLVAFKKNRTSRAAYPYKEQLRPQLPYQKQRNCEHEKNVKSSKKTKDQLKHFNEQSFLLKMSKSHQLMMTVTFRRLNIL